MLLKYERAVRFDSSDFVSDGAVRASKLLWEFEDIASVHSSMLGFGIDDLMKKNVIWVITKMKYRYLMPLMPDTDYILATYPRPNGSLMYQRDFYISDSEGNKLVIASSEWCHINFVTRRIEQLALTYDGEYFTENAFPEGIERIRPKGLELAGSHVVESCDLDANQHTNNRRYADMGLDILGKTNIHELNITFSKETRLGDEIKLFASPDRSTAAGKLPDGALIFAMTVK